MIEFDIKEESERIDAENELFWQKLDREDENIDYAKLQADNKAAYADLLLSGLGEDIKAVTEGRVKVKLPWKFKIKRFIQRLFTIFS